MVLVGRSIMLKSTLITHALGLGTLAIGSCPVLFSPLISIPSAMLFALTSSALLVKVTLSIGNTTQITVSNSISTTPATVTTTEIPPHPQPTLAASH